MRPLVFTAWAFAIGMLGGVGAIAADDWWPVVPEAVALVVLCWVDWRVGRANR